MAGGELPQVKLCVFYTPFGLTTQREDEFQIVSRFKFDLFIVTPHVLSRDCEIQTFCYFLHKDWYISRLSCFI